MATTNLSFSKQGNTWVAKYTSQGEQEYNDEECAMIGNAAQLCTPAFIDAINSMLAKEKDEQ